MNNLQNFSTQQDGNEMKKINRSLKPLAISLAVLVATFAGTQAIATTPSPSPQTPVYLGTASTFTILSKSGVTNVPPSAVTGDAGTSPITGAAMHLTCNEVSGTIFSVDAAGPAPCTVTNAPLLTAAVSDMEAATVNAAGRSQPDFVELGAGEIGGMTLKPGLYKWGTGLLISSDVKLKGGPDDVWIFQIAGTMDQARGTKVRLAGGAVAKNVFWQPSGAVTIGPSAHFQGILLAKTMIAVQTGASVTGRLYAQTAVTLDKNRVTKPAN